MTCVPKEYEIKTKITWKFLFSGRGDWLLMGAWGIKIWLWGEGIFLGGSGGGMSKCLTSGGRTPPFPQYRKPWIYYWFLTKFYTRVTIGSILLYNSVQTLHKNKIFAPTVIPISNATWYPFKMAKDSWKSCILSKLVRQVLKISFSEIGTGS